MQLMTQAEYARHRGVGKPAVSNWKKAGLLVLAEDADGRPKVDVARTDMRINARVDPMRGRPATATAATVEPALTLAADTSDNGPTVASERLELLREQRRGLALKNARDAGELVDRMENERVLSEGGRLLRERVTAELRGEAERIAVENDPRVVMRLLEDIVDRVFTEVARDIASGALDEEDDEFGIEADAPESAAA